MHMTLYIVAYSAMGIFVIASLVRVLKWSKIPMHLRWELYPVAHEGKKAQYGGSYLEESEWWTKPRKISLWGELKVMIPEILFLVALKEHNPRLWSRSFPFHFGLYLIVGCTVLMLFTAALGAVSPAIVTPAFGNLLHHASLIFGVAGLCLGAVGALGLLYRRLADAELKNYTTSTDILNLIFFVVAFSSGLVTFILVDSDFSRVEFFMSNLVTGNLATLPGSGLEIALPAATVILMSILLAYIPLTHMSHFIGKYFAFHSIRWNDTPNLPGGKQEKTINRLLSRPISWSAPHIKGDGKKSWLDVATDKDQKEERK